MEQFCRGESGAFDALFARHAPTVHGYLLRLTGNAASADDLTQTTFLSVVRGRGRFQHGARFKPWLFAIATNAARDLARRRRPEVELAPEGQPLPDELVTHPHYEDPALQRRVREALEQLPEGQRVPIILHRFEGLSFAEIGASMGLTETAVKVRAHRGYERLRQLLCDLEEKP